jgi:hypothetical protein
MYSGATSTPQDDSPAAGGAVEPIHGAADRDQDIQELEERLLEQSKSTLEAPDKGERISRMEQTPQRLDIDLQAMEAKATLESVLLGDLLLALEALPPPTLRTPAQIARDEYANSPADSEGGEI